MVSRFKDVNMKTILLSSSPSISIPQSKNKTHTFFSTRNRKKFNTARPLMGGRSYYNKYIKLPAGSEQVKNLLEVKNSAIEPEIRQGYLNLVKKEKKNDLKRASSNEEIFKKAAKHYFEKEQERPLPLEDPPKPTPPNEPPTADTATAAAVVKDHKKPTIVRVDKMKQRKKTVKKRNQHLRKGGQKNNPSKLKGGSRKVSRTSGKKKKKANSYKSPKTNHFNISRY